MQSQNKLNSNSARKLDPTLPATDSSVNGTRLKKGETFAVGNKSTVLTCVEGALWITFASDPIDHLLSVGDRLVIPAEATAVIEALRPSTFTLDAKPDQSDL